MRFGTCLVLLLFFAQTIHAGENDFTIPEVEKKPYELGGRLETRYTYHRLDEDTSRCRLIYYQNDPGADTHEWQALGELTGSYRQSIFQANLLTHHAYLDSYQDDEWDNAIYEAYASLTPAACFTLDTGKKRVLWGKGYAWNPAGFLNRPKDPDDPAMNLEGRLLLGLDLIKSFSAGNLSNIGMTAMVLPVIDDWGNEDLGEKGDLNTALKLYLLWSDTDLDFIYFDGPEQPCSFGFDFAGNLAENFEVHGELAFQEDVPHVIIDATGTVSQTREDQLSYLLGLRYLNAMDTTFIAEYYHNGAGYSQDELDDFFNYQETAFNQWLVGGNASVMQRVDQITRPYYHQRNFGENYFYLKISQKEPFNILYFNPWVAIIVNLQDASFNLQPGLTWTPVTNLELNLRVGMPVGDAKTEFGEKLDALRSEIWMRYYF